MQISLSERHVRPGDLVRVRQRRWRVVEVRAYEACQVLTLASVGTSDADGERRLIAPFDTIEPIERVARVRLVTRRHWRRACRHLIAANTPPGALRSGRLARIDLLPHQLEPALAVVRGMGSRLLLADDVGLGKTIQAGLVLSELRARAAAERALILTPPGLREQWAHELAERFGIAAEVVDARDVRRRVATLPVGVNPWSTTDVVIASIDYAKRPEVVRAVGACRWDVLIVDEAHGVAGDRHEAVAAIAARSPYVVLLTATPHNGDRRAFLSLCRLGERHDPILLFRRTRHDVHLGAGRRVHRLAVRPSAAEQRMHALVARFSRAVRDERRGHTRDDDPAAWLALTVLNKRALSSARSLEQTVERRLAALDSVAGNHPSQLLLPLADADGETDDADRAPALDGLALSDPARERVMLEELAAAAHLAAERETKIAALVRFLDRVAEPVIIFTEYRDTLLHLRAAIGRPAAVLHGGLARDERSTALRDFITGRQSILLTTDAAGEGLNLHQACRLVVNLELPWNPMRLEQRIGRVDRIGQRRTVHAIHLIARDTGEARLLARLRTRIARAQADIGAADPIGERAVARFLIDGTPIDETAVHNDVGEPTTGVPTPVVLAADAALEATRLAEARRFTCARDDRSAARREADGAWLTFSRASLRGQFVLLMRVCCEDASGRLMESAIVPVAIHCAHGHGPIRDRRLVEQMIDAAMPDVRAAVDAAATSWREAAVACTRAFFDTRLSRERAIAATRLGPPVGTIQPGLFDRRADQERRAAQELMADAASDARRRIAAVEHASTVCARPPELLLIVAP
jgi:superfamily II DNA or RNA helicase